MFATDRIKMCEKRLSVATIYAEIGINGQKNKPVPKTENGLIANANVMPYLIRFTFLRLRDLGFFSGTKIPPNPSTMLFAIPSAIASLFFM